MIGFSYIYKSSEEIFSSFINVGVLWAGGIIGIGITILMTLACIFFILPSIIVCIELRKKQSEKKRKKKLLEQILVQKEIEDEIDTQVHIEEQKM